MNAELLRLRKWPVLWVLLGVGLTLDLLFGYVFDYLSYRTGSRPVSEDAPLLAGLLPAGVPVTTVEGMPMFGGAILLVLGALAAGSGYGWGTWKTVLTTSPSRIRAFSGLVGALGAVVMGLVAAMFALNFAAAAVIATAESQSLAPPGFADLARTVGGALLTHAMWTAFGVLLGILARGPALAVGLGMVWALAVENLLRGTGNVLAPVGAVADLLPGTAAGSLAGALGAATFTDGGTPGVLSTLDGAQAALLLAAWTALFVVSAGALLTRRDVT
ncbi:ABC transporter permease [Dactylosporangium sp. NBC_01737]|uniref:ABC transporter permease n=1 Tax=Dactylosporangium sp. NBC_01737 TaxID=2975959 RepID=UPI002E0F21FA|nr:ABC transporter permease [Dactylosporangium sp. NBC_01737]